MTDRFQFANLFTRRQRLLALAVPSLIAAFASTSQAAGPSVAKAMSLKPIQADAVFELVDEADFGRCQVVTIDDAGQSGWEVVGPEGTILRRFVDTNGDKSIDVWSYFNFGIESYRDIDSDGNRKADQYRWLGNAGTRWGIDRDEDGKIDSWKRISAEEVTAEVVASLRSQDVTRFNALLLTNEELQGLGLGKEKAEQIAAKLRLAIREFADLAKSQQSVSKSAKWLQFAAPAPGLVPAGTGGSTKDVLVYENVVAMFEDAGKGGQLMVGTLVKVDELWRLVALPVVGSGDGSIAQSTPMFFSPSGDSSAISGALGSDEMQALVGNLEAIDRKLAVANEKDAPQLHAARAELVERLISQSVAPEDKESWARQLVDTLRVAVQSGQYPAGMERLKTAGEKFARQNPALAAYADFESLQTEWIVRQQDAKDEDQPKIQEWYHESLETFVDEHPRSLEAAKALLQLALGKEFDTDKEAAVEYYKKVRDNYAGTDEAEKAAGAVNRLESVGRKIELTGETIEGKSFKLSALRGRPVVIHYWATWCGVCTQDMKVLSRLQARYKRAGLTIVGVNVDAQRDEAVAFLNENRLPWIQLFEEGGLEYSRLSKAFGVQTLPTMMLIDETGTVVNNNIGAAELDEAIDKLVK
ncbi:TlpA family protein disulfide reductase [Stieleria sp. JC731]|uniref:TlpA family protein disulfide reductase n=1 Tax=Pirellulaceae TaxID=2691357 RepID=UPI001E644925|nr:TlpA disulfide reductase family protein [Stieleria sp. JC731]MCC9602187.1 TlpA family protein disulfide reductase [Stieleria sp. JC731]